MAPFGTRPAQQTRHFPHIFCSFFHPPLVAVAQPEKKLEKKGFVEKI